MSTQWRKYLLNLVNFVNGKQIYNYEIQLYNYFKCNFPKLYSSELADRCDIPLISEFKQVPNIYQLTDHGNS